MKTFETEKGNIPSGATHYLDEQEGCYFCWFIINGDAAEICVLDGVGFELKWHKCTNEHKGINVKAIPQPEKVEWVNGDECIYMNSSEVHKFIGVDPTRNDFCYIKASCSAVNWVEVAKLSKPETPQQREDLERLENGKAFYELMSEIEVSVMNPEDHGTPNQWDELRDEWQQVYILQAEKLNYRKEVK